MARTNAIHFEEEDTGGTSKDRLRAADALGIYKPGRRLLEILPR
jgi:hypothetical protein